MRLFAALLALVFVLPGCYHTTVITGRTPGSTVVERPFALGFAFGLVPPPEVNVAQECPQGVAMVETEWSFVNSLVNALTVGIVNPQHIKVTCASGSASLDQPTINVAENASVADVQAAFAEAADEAVAHDAPVYVAFTE